MAVYLNVPSLVLLNTLTRQTILLSVKVTSSNGALFSTFYSQDCHDLGGGGEVMAKIVCR